MLITQASNKGITEPVIVDNSLIAYQDYSTILDNYGLSYEILDYYYQVGEITQTQGWILHISVIRSQYIDLLNQIIPILLGKEIPFKIAKDEKIAHSLLHGLLGYSLLGKVVSIYPKDDEQIVSISEILINTTTSFQGPRILTDYHLGSVVYTRYGSFNPVIILGSDGVKEKYIYGKCGNLVKDTYSIPFALEDAPWPFSTNSPVVTNNSNTILKDKYKLMSFLKVDARGNVYKALYLKKSLFFKWCVIKQGRQGMTYDESNRCMRDRLIWQFELHKKLEKELPIPSAYDLFEEKGDTYLVLEYIKGKPLDEVLFSTYKGRIWVELSIKEKLLLINFLLQILNMVGTAHSKGYVHRDITTPNFLVTRKNKLFMIDLELVYSEKLERPSPAFKLGTAGFMSPEQQLCKKPTIKEDVYAIGATMLVVLTGLEPQKFEINRPELLQEQIRLFIPDQSMVTLITDCLSIIPNKRPNLEFVKLSVEIFQNKMNSGNKLPINKSQCREVKLENIKETIDYAIQSLPKPLMTTKDQLWFSRTIQEEKTAYYQMEGLSVYGGLSSGISGVLYLLARAKRMGVCINDCFPRYQHGCEFLLTLFLKNKSNISGGLYNGTSGVALAIGEGIKSGLLSNSRDLSAQLLDCLRNNLSDGFGVAKGISGQGIATLNCMAILEDEYLEPFLHQIVASLLDAQQKDGSWVTYQEGRKGGKLKITGFDNGVAGIICFLAAYYSKFSNSYVQNSIMEGLGWLTKNAQKKGSGFIWHLSNQSNEIGIGINRGLFGIALAYIKAYAHFKEPLYKKMAEGILHNHQTFTCMRDFTYASGLAGLGEVYLEAIQVLQSEQWKKRVNWITQIFMTCHRQQPDGSFYWMPDTYPIPTADFMIGNSGIIHFLLRYIHSTKLSLPLF